jgi:hypothetical protein
LPEASVLEFAFRQMGEDTAIRELVALMMTTPNYQIT